MSEATQLAFDPDALRERYRQERGKRLRDDGNEQYIEMTGEFAHYLKDPYIHKKIERDPVTSEVDVVIIGGGFGGLQAGARLREAGVKDIRIIEKGGDFGGTWYWNRYPGAQCDIESYCYLPLLEELNYVPKEKYSYAKEILAHSQAIGKHYDLYKGALFQTEVTGMTWDEENSRWIIETNQGDAIKAQFVAMANGPLHRPKLPGIPGVRDFKGYTFHTSRWDYAYTGGGPDGGLSKLAAKRVGIIGTGATAIQCIPFLGEFAKQLYVFQRTPSSVDVRGNKPTDPEWAESLTPGWHKARMDNFNGLLSGIPQETDLVADYWTDVIVKMFIKFEKGGDADMSAAELMEMTNFEKMEEIRGRVDSLVEDPEVAEKLKPYYKMFCKRPTCSDEYLPTFNRPNVQLVDTDGKGVERITEKGLLVNGLEYGVDCIIFSTGFEVGTSYTRRAGYDVEGRDGIRLSEYWREGTRTLHGMGSHGFPNLFIMHAQQAGLTPNYPHMLDECAVHQSHIMAYSLDKGYKAVEVTREGEQNWVDTIKGYGGRFDAIGLGGSECTPGYYNNEGKPNPAAAQNAPYGGGSIRFFELLKEWREDGNFDGLEFSS